MHANSASNKTSFKQIFIASGIRTLISAGALAVSLFVSFVDIIATFIGLVVIKATILIFSFIKDTKKGKGGNKVEDESN